MWDASTASFNPPFYRSSSSSPEILKRSVTFGGLFPLLEVRNERSWVTGTNSSSSGTSAIVVQICDNSILMPDPAITSMQFNGTAVEVVVTNKGAVASQPTSLSFAFGDATTTNSLPEPQTFSLSSIEPGAQQTVIFVYPWETLSYAFGGHVWAMLEEDSSTDFNLHNNNRSVIAALFFIEPVELVSFGDGMVLIQVSVWSDSYYSSDISVQLSSVNNAQAVVTEQPLRVSSVPQPVSFQVSCLDFNNNNNSRFQISIAGVSHELGQPVIEGDLPCHLVNYAVTVESVRVSPIAKSSPTAYTVVVTVQNNGASQLNSVPV
jgi:hypothetical protein